MKKETRAQNPSSPVEDATPDGRIKSADLPASPDSRLDSIIAKFHPISDATIPYRDLTDATTKRESIHRLIEKLDVKRSLRYQRTIEDTYCNVYSYDYCYFSHVYLPTVWWTDESLGKILDGQTVEPVFNETVVRIYSSAIHDWFLKWGASFGWKRMTDLDEIQHKVNTEGGIGIICAKRKIAGLSGHIVPIVPESNTRKAYRENGVVIYPLQSQAGKLNYHYFSKARRDWWNHERYSSHVFYYHD
ncbi:MAG: hypothetical protein A3D31_02295 [Candidatus Fluviicola riflensis]|nr:MAG: hypothetical protein CHH17_12745 [Candidatus Fluviicola riflensis]OGS78825.1 MAG: hypothetical protein A3D31_02295 [Candidatus Fluviicola riflensis]OGS85847.1 MAG: hypothetical protein A3E30_09780 [Fluviicola sp. RIFCSPHIGHO2_12_FULL_43_24]OGS86256.1 MAG: hypothetical protein A2724_01750 [Fluviicola sp. RIFCSPHIGHO2_01_FULL_43_53]